MNTHAIRTDHTVYTNTGIEKRNLYQASPKRLYKNTETVRRAIRSPGIGTNGPAVDSVIRFFRGTVVNGDVSGIEWGTL